MGHVAKAQGDQTAAASHFAEARRLRRAIAGGRPSADAAQAALELARVIKFGCSQVSKSVLLTLYSVRKCLIESY